MQAKLQVNLPQSQHASCARHNVALDHVMQPLSRSICLEASLHDKRCVAKRFNTITSFLNKGNVFASDNILA